HEVSRAARSAPPPTDAPSPSDLLLDGLAVLVTEGRAEAAPLLRRAARVFAEEEISMAERLRWGFLAVVAAIMVWDEQRWHTIDVRQLRSCREAGLLAQLVIYVNSMAILKTWCGDFAAAASLVAEAEAIAAATGTRFAPFAALWLAGFRGAEAEATPLIGAGITDSRATGPGLALQKAQRVSPVFYNRLRRHEPAGAPE